MRVRRSLLLTCGLLAIAAVVHAQQSNVVLGDGTTATKVVIYGTNGTASTGTTDVSALATEETLSAMAADIATLANNLSIDATHGSAVRSNGPQLMCDGESALPSAVTAGQSVRVLCNLYGAPVMTQFGCTPGSFISAASVNKTAIKASGGTLRGLWVTSLDATPVYVKLYNDTSANIDETDTPVWRWSIPSNSTAANATAAVNLMPASGIAFTTAITLRATTGIADNDTGALTANEVLVSYCYE